MPLLRADRCGGTAGDRRSIADFLALDTTCTESSATPKMHNGNARRAEGEWRWEERGGSPEAAPAPAALVPPACFPPARPPAYSSFSESARPGAWDDSQAISDLVSSLTALSLPSGAPLRSLASLNETLSKTNNYQLDLWEPRENRTRARDDLQRRASFCGVVPSSGEARVPRWSGVLPERELDPSGGFSSKVFMGGLPWDITEHALLQALKHFNPIKVEWPGREPREESPRGFAYVTFESERRVRALLAGARRDAAGWYYRIPSRKMRSKEVQVIPWAVCECNWMAAGGAARLEPAKTVFVGALHGMLGAPALAFIMHELFGGVVYAGIDTDKNKYPIGSGRVSFDNVRSYVRAISAGHVEICTDKFTKKVQVDPYLEDALCSQCSLTQGPYFCREPCCFRYFCWSCWAWRHGAAQHRRLTRARALYPDCAPDHESTPSPATSSSSPSADDGADSAWLPLPA